IGDAERRLTAAMAGNGAVGLEAVEAWGAPRKAEGDRIRLAVNEIAQSRLTLSKLSGAARLFGGLGKKLARVWRRAALETRAQCLKCRVPVNTMAMPWSSAALITSSSRTEPPG